MTLNELKVGAFDKVIVAVDPIPLAEILLPTTSILLIAPIPPPTADPPSSVTVIPLIALAGAAACQVGEPVPFDTKTCPEVPLETKLVTPEAD